MNRLTILLIALLAGLPAPVGADPPEALPTSGATDMAELEGPPEPPPGAPRVDGEPGAALGPQKVILRVNRYEEVMGYVELEDGDVLVVRRRHDDEVVSYSKTRILRIIRLARPEPGQRGQVRLRNGQVSEGAVIEDDFDFVELEVEGIRIRFKRDVVDEVVLEPTFLERYEEIKRTLKPNMFDQHLGLCRWLVGERRYELARQELQALLRRNAEMAGARRLLTFVEAQLALQRGEFEARPQEPPEGLPVAATRTSGPVYDADVLPIELLTHDDVNLIRVYEIDVDDPPKMAIEPDTIRALLERYGTSPLVPAGSARTALFRADPIEIVKIMFELRARELYPQIRVLSEPRALNLFRQRVHNTWLMNSCATARCHGGVDGGRLFLHRANHKNPRVRMTNLLILERLELEPKWPLINYDAPVDSLIVQYGLPRDSARKPHPDVSGWRPVFTRGNRRALDHTLEWIQSMMIPRPEYPIDFEPPVLDHAPPPAPLDEPEAGRTGR